MNQATHQAGTALITGASTGIGAVYADRLAARGHDLILVARDRAKLDALAKRLASEHGRAIEVIAADLTRAEDVRRIEQRLREDAAISTLINNAGVGSTSPLLASDPDQLDAMIQLNTTSLTRLTRAVLPGLLGRGAGTIVNISSIAAVAPEILNATYSGSKAYVLAFSQALHKEVADQGVRVQVVLPGAIGTPFWDAAGISVQQLPQDWVMSPEDLVDAALSGLEQGELVTVPSLPSLEDWQAFDDARRALAPNLSRVKPARRYGVA